MSMLVCMHKQTCNQVSVPVVQEVEQIVDVPVVKHRLPAVKLILAVLRSQTAPYDGTGV